MIIPIIIEGLNRNSASFVPLWGDDSPSAIDGWGAGLNVRDVGQRRVEAGNLILSRG
jgi:hypothetical protein